MSKEAFVVSEKTWKIFTKDLADLINTHSLENACDVPDYILAEMLAELIKAFGPHIKTTLDWHGCNSVCHPGPAGECTENVKVVGVNSYKRETR